MTLGGIAAQKLGQKRRAQKLAAAFPAGARCQKCLEYGHWSYECTGKRKFVHRESRTKTLNKNINEMNEKRSKLSTTKLATKKTSFDGVKPKKSKLNSNSSSSDDSSDSDSSDSDSSDSDDSSSSSSSSSSADSDSSDSDSN
ncbi:Zinc finger CCHC domain-containing protein 10 [Pseudolycoriella hygida]|uniref:Zinc finger CCHC domain-containing protein 10 n=1 Tax=Pseudolycoriella hygida TaxID=35572 RepID=A0A9Q0RW65_9DIPT|nr:Zinc finger CCHC domain-containing protein 10 [Pseudolycoriella hygida]KAJ6635157.1 Zinc finger CCHC domain-containing protein 10 [Pseudolycoriella hygida]